MARKLTKMKKNLKKGQFGFVDIFSYILYFIAFVAVLFLLNLPGCKKSLQTDIGVDADFSQIERSVSADSQLNSYLRTPMPEKSALLARIDWLDEKKSKGLDFAAGLDWKKAKGFLERNPGLHEGRDYQGFISGLYAAYSATSDSKEREKVRDSFRAVTAAMFMRSVKDNNGIIYYILPLGVDFDNADGGKPGNEEYLCGNAKYELCFSGRLPAEFHYLKPVASVQLIPLPDGKIAKVEFRYIREVKARLPEP